MVGETLKSLLLALAVTIASTALFVAGFEVYKSWEYDRWKRHYTSNGDWYGLLTVPSANKTLMWEYRPNGTPIPTTAPITTNSYGLLNLPPMLDHATGLLPESFAQTGP
jgi:hypothetical protein